MTDTDQDLDHGFLQAALEPVPVCVARLVGDLIVRYINRNPRRDGRG